VKSRELQFPGLRETTLHAQAWLPEGEPRAVVVISHGLAEHGGRYAAVAERLVARNYAVYAAPTSSASHTWSRTSAPSSAAHSASTPGIPRS